MTDPFALKQGQSFEDSEFRALNRKRLLKGLFYETTMADKSTVMYTLKDDDHMGYKSLSRLYLEANDPTEYSFAVQHMESYDHWQMLVSCAWFRPYITKWRKELEIKMKSEALANIILESRDKKSPSRFTSNKYILERGWEPKEGQGKTKGRPTKADISAAAYDLASESQRLQEDYDRLTAGKAN